MSEGMLMIFYYFSNYVVCNAWQVCGIDAVGGKGVLHLNFSCLFLNSMFNEEPSQCWALISHGPSQGMLGKDKNLSINVEKYDIIFPY